MITEQQKEALLECYAAAKLADHIFPAMAACETMEESSWGTTRLYLEGKNPFGEKQQHVPQYPTINLPTWEIEHGTVVHVMGAFVKFPSLVEAFKGRMSTFRRLPGIYASALNADSPEKFINEVCGYWDMRQTPPTYHSRWSTDPNKPSKVISIYNAHRDILQ